MTSMSSDARIVDGVQTPNPRFQTALRSYRCCSAAAETLSR